MFKSRPTQVWNRFLSLGGHLTEILNASTEGVDAIGDSGDDESDQVNADNADDISDATSKLQVTQFFLDAVLAFGVDGELDNSLAFCKQLIDIHFDLAVFDESRGKKNKTERFRTLCSLWERSCSTPKAPQNATVVSGDEGYDIQKMLCVLSSSAKLEENTVSFLAYVVSGGGAHCEVILNEAKTYESMLPARAKVIVDVGDHFAIIETTAKKIEQGACTMSCQRLHSVLSRASFLRNAHPKV